MALSTIKRIKNAVFLAEKTQKKAHSASNNVQQTRPIEGEIQLGLGILTGLVTGKSTILEPFNYRPWLKSQIRKKAAAEERNPDSSG